LIVDIKIYKKVKAKRGDLVIFEFPKDPSKDFIKRVMGLESEKVEIINNKIYINDTLIDDPWGYYKSSGETKYLREFENFGPAVIPENSLFVLGDNRHNSLDSRLFGFVHLSKVKGKALYIYWAKDKSRIGTSLITGSTE
jgi:signal peptidase I